MSRYRVVTQVLVFLVSVVSFVTAGTPRFAYIPNIDDGTVSEFVVNSLTGQFLPNGYVTAGDHPRSFVSVENFAYVANMNSGNITGYSLDQSTGQLNQLSGSPYSAPGNPYALIAHPNGKFLYAVDALGSHVYVYAVHADGSLSQLAAVAAGTSPRFLAITGSGSFLYVSNLFSNDVTAYKVNATTGLLTAIETYATGGSQPSNVMTSGNFLYVTNASSNNVSAFVINPSTGALTNVPGSPFPAGNSPYALTREYYGHFIYVGNSQSNDISAYAVNQTTGALTQIAGSPFAATMGTQALKVDPSNTFLYAADAGADEVMVYKMNLSTGALTNTSSVRTHGIGFDVYVTNGPALSIQPSIAYVMNNDNDIPFNVFPLATYSINPSNGALTPLPSEVQTADISALTTDATGRLLYLYSPGFHGSLPNLFVCLVQTDGNCIDNQTLSAAYGSGADDQQGKYHYSGEFDDNFNYLGVNGYQYSISESSFSAPLVPGSPFQIGNELGMDLTGKYLYSDNDGGSVYKVDPADGTPVYLGPSGAPYGQQLILPSVLHPNARFLYTPINGGVNVDSINPANGKLSVLSFAPTTTGSPLIEQTGNFAYISDGNTVTTYSINKNTGALTYVGTPLHTTASAELDASGNFLYLLLNGMLGQNAKTSTPTIITAYKIDHTTGALTMTSSYSFATASSSGYSMTTTRIIH